MYPYCKVLQIVLDFDPLIKEYQLHAERQYAYTCIICIRTNQMTGVNVFFCVCVCVFIIVIKDDPTRLLCEAYEPHAEVGFHYLRSSHFIFPT